MANKGVLDLSDSAAAINATSSIVDLSHATFSNSENVSLLLDPQSLLIVPAGFDPASYFHVYSSPGLLHHSGSTLTVTSSYSFGGSNEIVGYLDCQGGTFSTLSGGSITVNGGLGLSGSGVVNLGSGWLIVNDAVSGMTGGSLSSNTQCVGYTGGGTFTHSAGVNNSRLYLGDDSGDRGTYLLSGTGRLNASSENVGNSGVGIFVQTGGVNSVSNTLCVGANSGGSGTYSLSPDR